jgi:hypothetical protein
MTSYEISVRGFLDSGLLDELGVRSIEERPARTVLLAEVGAGEGLDAVLQQLSALGIEFLEARQVDDERAPS